MKIWRSCITKFYRNWHMCFYYFFTSTVIRQKGESQNGVSRKQRMCAYLGVKNVRFSEDLACFFSWNTRFEICPLPYYRRLAPDCIPNDTLKTFCHKVWKCSESFKIVSKIFPWRRQFFKGLHATFTLKISCQKG